MLRLWAVMGVAALTVSPTFAAFTCPMGYTAYVDADNGNAEGRDSCYKYVSNAATHLEARQVR